MTDSSPFNTAADLRDRGFSLRTPPVNIVAFDPAGDGDDNDALILLSREEHQRGETHDPDFAVEFVFRVLMAHQMQQGLEYPDKLAHLLHMHKRLNKWEKDGRERAHVFAIENNGVGYAYASDLRNRVSASVVPYTTIGSGMGATDPTSKVTMPRLKGLSNLRVLMETHYLKIEPHAPGRDDLIAQFNSMVWRRKGRPEAMQGAHDDLVMALTGGAWVGSMVVPPYLRHKAFAPRARQSHTSSRMRIQ